MKSIADIMVQVFKGLVFLSCIGLTHDRDERGGGRRSNLPSTDRVLVSVLSSSSSLSHLHRRRDSVGKDSCTFTCAVWLAKSRILG